MIQLGALYLLIITLIGANFTALSITVDNIIFDHRDNLRLHLDWTHKFSEVFEEQRNILIGALYRRSHFYMINYEAIEQLNGFFTAAAHFRNVLVFVNPRADASDDVGENAEILTVILGSMPYVLDDLKKNIEEWNKDEHMLRKSLTVMDEKPLKWFKEHGFDEYILNNITVQTLKMEICKFIGEGKPFDSYFSSFGKLLLLSPARDIGSKLAVLFTFGNNPKALYSLKKHLTREGSTVQPQITDIIMDSLRKLGDKEGPLNKLFGNGRNGGLYPIIMPFLNKAVFLEEECDQYMKVLVNVCTNLHTEVYRFRNIFESIADEYNPTYYWEYGFLFNREQLDSCSISGFLRSFSWSVMLISELEDALLDAIKGDECATRYVHGKRLALPKPLMMSGMIIMGITPVWTDSI